MIQRINISTRLMIPSILMFLFALVILWVFIGNLGKIKNLSIQKTEDVMLSGHMDKIKTATHSVAIAISSRLNDQMDEATKDEIVRNSVNNIRFESDSSGYFFGYRGTICVALPTIPERVGKDLAETKDPAGVYFVKELNEAAKRGGDFVRYQFDKAGKGILPKLAYAEFIPGTDIWIGTGVYIDNIDSQKAIVNSHIAALVKKTIVSFVIIVLFLFALILVPLNLLIRKSILKPLNEAILISSEVANGNLTISSTVHRTDELGKMLDAQFEMIRKLNSTITEINNSAKRIANESKLLTHTSVRLSEGTSEQASSVEEVSSTVEQMTSNIQQSTENAVETEKIARNASKSIEQVIIAENASISFINEIAQKITIINDIAFQTNILALNAAVEAARAGEHGKGFAVVASEVRKLAEKSKIAADEIGVITNSSVNQTTKSKKLMDELHPAVLQTSKLTNEISAASNEQSSGIEQVNSAIQQLNQVVQENASVAEQLSNQAEQLSNQANEMFDSISLFKIK